jgi:hypothetical protein
MPSSSKARLFNGMTKDEIGGWKQRQAEQRP